MSAIAEADLDVAAPPARRPGTPVRFLLFVLAALGSTFVLAVGFPRGAPDRLPVLALALALAVRTVFRPDSAIREFCSVFPLSGLLAGIFGSSDPVAWPVLLFGGLAVGWTFRFLYDFESVPDPSRLDGPLRALVAVWAIGAVLAIARASTLWAAFHGLRGRTVNGEGLAEAAAIRDSVLALAILGAGAAFFFLLRRSGAAARTDAMRAALVGIAFSAAAALLQAIGVFPAESRPFWKLTGRLSGGATDPNALGVLCGLGIVVLLGLIVSSRGTRWAIWALLPLPIGLALSGSRSGFVVALFGSVVVVALAAIGRRLRAGLAIAVLALSIALLFFRGSAGDLGERLGHLFRPSLTLDDRASSRPILWRAAGRQFAESPLEGGGLGSFSWRLPDLAAADGDRVPMRDNPGSAYLQALAETGAIGLLLTLVFAVSIARQALSRAREAGVAGSAAAVLAFLVALAVGSHWLSPEVSFLFFLFCASIALPAGGARSGARLRTGLVVLYAVFALRAVLATTESAETFRHGKLVGFHAPETGPGGPFRWTRRRFAVWVGPRAPEQISLANYSPEGKAVGITARAGEGPILYRRSLAPGEAVSLALWAGSSARPFLFELDRAFVPKRLGVSDDRRELGLLAVLPEGGNP